MKINILILDDTPTGLKETMDFFQVAKLMAQLQENGISAKVVTKLSDLQKGCFYLYFVRGQFDPKLLLFSPQIVVMNVSLREVGDAARSFHFAGIIRYNYYKSDAPFIFGFPEVGEQLALFDLDKTDAYDFKQGEIYYLLRPKNLENKTLVSFLLDYLKIYQKLGLEKREGTVGKRE